MMEALVGIVVTSYILLNVYIIGKLCDRVREIQKHLGLPPRLR